MIYVGIDPGMSATAIVVGGDGIQRSHVVQTKKNDLVGVVGDFWRALEITGHVVDFLGMLLEADRCVFAVEGPAFGRGGGNFGTVQVGVLHPAVYSAITAVREGAFDDVCITAPPKTLKKFASGNGNASKEEMRRAIEKRWNVRYPTHDLCDAYALMRLAEAYTEENDPTIIGKLEVHRLVGGEFTEVLHAPDAARRRRRRRKCATR